MLGGICYETVIRGDSFEGKSQGTHCMEERANMEIKAKVNY